MGQIFKLDDPVDSHMMYSLGILSIISVGERGTPSTKSLSDRPSPAGFQTETVPVQLGSMMMRHGFEEFELRDKQSKLQVQSPDNTRQCVKLLPPASVHSPTHQKNTATQTPMS